MMSSPDRRLQISPSQASGFSLNSPSIFLIIIILAIIFFISGVVHLLVRFLMRPPRRDPDEIDSVTALQGQLQQLFHLHDAGVDQSFIDTLPVFNYKAIIGVKDPFDCAVCLCEFEGVDNLRLLPQCSHAFHMQCIDTWLLSHSTCPLCRAGLLSDFTPNPPIVVVLESASESSREMAGDVAVGRVNSDREEEEIVPSAAKVVHIKLGKFKNIDVGGGGEASNNADARRCFSMGSFAYVMDETSSLQVPIRTPPLKKPSIKKSSLPLTPGHRPAISECGQELNRFEGFKVLEPCSDSDLKSIARVRTNYKESFSVSKIWLRGKHNCNAATLESSRRAFSFRLPITRADEISNGEEVERCDSLDSQTSAHSFARRTLLWLIRKPNKSIHSAVSTNA